MKNNMSVEIPSQNNALHPTASGLPEEDLGMRSGSRLHALVTRLLTHCIIDCHRNDVTPGYRSISWRKKYRFAGLKFIILSLNYWCTHIRRSTTSYFVGLLVASSESLYHTPLPIHPIRMKLNNQVCIFTAIPTVKYDTIKLL